MNCDNCFICGSKGCLVIHKPFFKMCVSCFNKVFRLGYYDHNELCSQDFVLLNKDSLLE